jgi:hypothetical protein
MKKKPAHNNRFGAMAASENVLSFGNSIQLFYIGPATLTRAIATAPNRGRCAQYNNFLQIYPI